MEKAAIVSFPHFRKGKYILQFPIQRTMKWRNNLDTRIYEKSKRRPVCLKNFLLLLLTFLRSFPLSFIFRAFLTRFISYLLSLLQLFAPFISKNLACFAAFMLKISVFGLPPLSPQIT